MADAKKDASNARWATTLTVGGDVIDCRGTVSRLIRMAHVRNVRMVITWTGSPCALDYPKTVRRLA